METSIFSRRFNCVLLALLLLCGAAYGAPPAAKPAAPAAARAKPEAMKPITDDPNIPRVLLIGDSISIGYTVPVREKLKGKANVHRPSANCAATINGLKDLDKWLGDPKTPAGKWDVIHFNWGLHDLKYHDGKGTIQPVDKGTQQVPVAEYEKNLRTLVKRLKETGATLIWASTTPVPEGTVGRVPGDAKKYNEAAARVMKEESVQTNDLYAFAEPKLAEIQLKANVHFSPTGYDALAGAVAEKIEKALEARKARAQK
jgi:lysophospholipase L1-like esterase